MAAPSTTIDGKHAVQLARHLAGLHKCGRHRPDGVHSALSFAGQSQVRCGGKVFEVHASVVTCASEYFRAMLEPAMAESGSRSFEMHEVIPAATSVSSGGRWSGCTWASWGSSRTWRRG
jgi:hypothetical protein